MVGQVAELSLGSFGPLQGRHHDLAVLGAELLEHRVDGRSAFGEESLVCHL